MHARTWSYGLPVVSLLLAGCGEEPTSRAQRAALAGDQAWVATDQAGANVIAAAVAAQTPVDLGEGADGSQLVAVAVPRSALPELSSAMHEELNRCGGFLLRDSLEDARTFSRSNSARVALKLDVTLDKAAIVTSLIAELATSNLEKTIGDLSAFPDRFHENDTGKEASEWIRDLWQSYAKERPDVKVELISHERTPQPSVMLTIPGAKSPDEQVILGGHLDSINLKGGLAPGADDNASGIAVLSEVIRAALKLGYRPDRSVVFYGYAAEEIGLVGSAEIARAASDRKTNVAAVLQLDMTNVNPAPEPYMGIVTDYATPALSELAKQLIDSYVHIPWKTTKCGYACSDHASWFERDFPVHHVHETTSEESNDQIHTERDTLALTQGHADHSLHFARYAAAFMAEVAKGTLPPPPECDATRPCANGGMCQAGVCLDPPTVTGGAGGASGAGGSAGVGGASSAGASAGGVAGMPSTVVGGGGTGGVTVAGAGTPPITDASAATPAAAADAGCACRAVGSSGSSPSALLLALLLGRLRLRRRPRKVRTFARQP